ncbi:MAG: SCP2 sterol-binding domain-containing protein, partial [Desulfobacterales bacterium]|nr:SCP2 sterol-binding domain-containing protein [Desulfobacterales bacterium]MDX2511966.1 SCP2 sterol-binding domain-containing protein [Desulfobacterales bacterium]
MQQKESSTITGPGSSECSSKTPPFKTIKALFAAMPSGMNPEAADGMEAVVQFHLTGSETMDGHLIIKEGGCSYSDGVHPNPTTSIRSDSELWLAISNNETSGEEAFLHQHYSVEGDMTILLKFNQLFAWAKVEDPCESIPAYKNEYDYHAFQPGQINRIVIFDGGPRDTGLSKTAIRVDHYCSGARSAGAEFEHVKLKYMSIHPCMGCYTCWT